MRLPLLVPLLLVLPFEAAGGYYLCVDPKTGRKIGQEQPCQPGKELGSYAPVTAEEQRAREAAARKSKREFERLRPGTYHPEEYMDDEELAAYRAQTREREDEARQRDAERSAREALQRAERAERIAQEAEAKARAAEEAAAQTPPPYPYPGYGFNPPYPSRPYPPRPLSPRPLPPHPDRPETPERPAGGPVFPVTPSGTPQPR